MNGKDPPELEERRRKLFRQMEWIFVYAPPLLALFVGLSAGALLAWLFPLRGTSFWGRWAAGTGLILGLPLIAYGVRTWWQNRTDRHG